MQFVKYHIAICHAFRLLLIGHRHVRILYPHCLKRSCHKHSGVTDSLFGGGGGGGLEDSIAMISPHRIYCAQSKVQWGAHGVNGGARFKKCIVFLRNLYIYRSLPETERSNYIYKLGGILEK